ncbi:UDP-glucose/GDP-mannose dehydrogenase family protein [Streptomyces sp. TRM64462]|uniref:UDP-glucose/GDP-mannose dehydrogenase family protein n=1 Tax=Streptomyces sp. TRM64462 TaxID=2741726 RepID=UPI00158606E1|nr:UDP-glucose/GDP-mannose dehydrogenase family protein [Streptomyces sp. TRM64462]
MAEVCEKSGANVAELADILGHDIRIGHRGMRPGLGYGGGCLPKDIRGFINRADELDASQAVGILREAAAVNTRRRQRVIDLTREELDTDLRGKRITVWGAAFKPETDDIRDSPALAVAQGLHDLGAAVTVTDPKALDNARKVHPELDYTDDPITAAEDADLLLHLTEWPQYAYIDPNGLAPRATTPKLIDARGTLNTDVWHQAGWLTRTLGRR